MTTGDNNWQEPDAGNTHGTGEPPAPWTTPGTSSQPETNPQWGTPQQPNPAQPPNTAQPPNSAQQGQPNQWGTPPPNAWGNPPQAPPGAPGNPYAPNFGGPSPYLAAPQPGVVPLRPLTLGEIYDGSIKSIRANPAVMFGLTAAVVALISVIELAMMIAIYSDLDAMLGVLNSSNPSSADILSSLSATLGQMGISMIVTLLLGTILNGLLTYAVAQAVIGRKPTLTQTWAIVKGRVLPLLGLSVLVGLIVASPFIVALGLVVAATLSESLGFLALAAIVCLLLGFLFALALMALTALATPVLVLERQGVIASLKRAWSLAKPHFWRVLGIIVLTNILMAILVSIISTPFTMLTSFMPTLSPASSGIVATIGGAIGSVIVYPFTSAVVALLYIDVRIRSEALDVELAAAAAQPR